MSDTDKLIKGLEEVSKLIHKANSLELELFLQYELFSWRWWVLVILPIISWGVWWKLRDKDKTVELLFASSIVIIISLILDSIGSRQRYWYYTYEIISSASINASWDIGLLPVVTMFFLQIRPKASQFIKTLLFSSILSFILEPIFKNLDFFEYPNWTYFYSFIIYVVMYNLSYLLYKKINNHSKDKA